MTWCWVRPRNGGYYLVNLSKPTPAIFQGIAWDGSEVLAQTLAAASRASLTVHLLETLPDINQPGDLPLRELASRTPLPIWDPGLITVVVPALNEAANLAGSLGPLLAEPGVEMLVVDSGSQYGIYELAHSLGASPLLSFKGQDRVLALLEVVLGCFRFALDSTGPGAGLMERMLD
ncbi:hypothetical protein DFAR_1240017 [Desulfarculales bacterium]